MTNRKLTSMVLGAATLLGASSAFASIDLPATGNGELVLFVTDTTTGNSYAKDLGVRLNDILGDSAVAGTPGGILNYTLPSFDLSADANFQSLINSTSAANLIWGVMGADTVGNNLASNPRRLVQTSAAGSTPSLTNAVLQGTVGDVNGYLGAVDGSLGANASLLGVGVSGAMFGVAGTPGASASTGFGGGITVSGTLGDTLGFYYFASGNTSGTATGGANNPTRVYSLANLTLTAAGLSAVSEVPLPAAVWLFGSGLLGMFGVGRRRKLQAA